MNDSKMSQKPVVAEPYHVLVPKDSKPIPAFTKIYPLNGNELERYEKSVVNHFLLQEYQPMVQQRLQQHEQQVANNKDTKNSQQSTEAWWKDYVDAWVKDNYKIVRLHIYKHEKYWEVIEQHDETIENHKDTKANTTEVSVELGTDDTSAKSVNSLKENTNPKSEEQNAKKSAPQNSFLVKHTIVETDNSAQITSNASITASKQTNCNIIDAQDNESENCTKWKPLRMDLVFLDLSQDEKKTLFLLRTFTSQLNKLTSENLSRLIDNIKNLPIDNLIRMQGVVDIIYEKAIREQMYLSLYAQICHLLKDKQIVNETGTLKTFSSFLLDRCMKNFDISLTENLVYERKKFEIDLTGCQKMKKLLMEECSREETEHGERFVGNCLFMGELFKWGLIQREMIFQLIDRLFKSTGNMAVICICSILTTIGKSYEDKFGKISSTYFEKIESLCEEELPPRIRFLLQDLLELRKNAWCPRIPSDEHEVVDLSNDFELIHLNEAIGNFVIDTSPDKIPEIEKPRVQHSDVPVGLLSREIFNSVTDEFKESPLDGDVKSEAKKYTVKFLSSCRTLPQCNKPVTISSPEFAEKLIKKETNDPELETWNTDKKTAKNGPGFRPKPTKSRSIPPAIIPTCERNSKNKKKSKDGFGRPAASCACGDEWGCCECNVWLNRISKNESFIGMRLRDICESRYQKD